MSDYEFDPEDDAREFVRRVFANTDRTPPDVIPQAGLTLADLERQSANYGRAVTGTVPGELLTDPDGLPLGVTASRTVTASSGGTLITAAQAAEFGISCGDLPGIFVIGCDHSGHITNERN